MRRNLIFILYRTLLVVAFPFIVLYVITRGLRHRRYFTHLGERFGFLPPQYQRTTHEAIWLHAVSVGEVVSCVELVKRLRTALPGSPVFLSCGTVAGRDAALAKLQSLVDGIFYAPLDYCFAVRRVLRIIKPAVLVVLETEIWPNLYREAKYAGMPLVVANGRISPRAAPAYQRHRWFFREVLSLPDLILAQSLSDMDHYAAAGAPPERVEVGGNLKYDFDPHEQTTPPEIAQFLNRNRKGPLWIAASTVGPEYEGDVDEDDAVLAAWEELRAEYPGLVLVLAPRRPERFGAVADKLRNAGAQFARRSELKADTEASLLLLDSVGELNTMFQLADVVFMGGTLAHRGGHNILEPASAGCPIVVGPHLENFAAVQEHFRKGDGFLEIAQASELREAIGRLLSARDLATALGGRARMLAEAERGATGRTLETIVQMRWRHIPHTVLPGPLRPFLFVLTRIWQVGGEWKRRSATVRRLSKPVISVGGLAMGGVGKTPFVRWLAMRFHEREYRSAILTRGYNRRSGDQSTVLLPGDTAPVEVTGDEAQLLLRSGIAAIGIGANRYKTGCLLERSYDPNLFLLDDGFQHASLHRDVDIVLLDGLDPLAGGYLFPAGRLREPLSALHRANLIVITRTAGRQFDGLMEHLRNQGVTAPVWYSSLRAGKWRTVEGRTEEIQGRTAVAFCGLGNPATFWLTLRDLGVKIVQTVEFPDHHRYSTSDLTNLAAKARRAGADVLLTTEKDAVNLPGIPAFPLLWLEVDIAMENAESFLDHLVPVFAPEGV